MNIKELSDKELDILIKMKLKGRKKGNKNQSAIILDLGIERLKRLKERLTRRD